MLAARGSDEPERDRPPGNTAHDAAEDSGGPLTRLGRVVAGAVPKWIVS